MITRLKQHILNNKYWKYSYAGRYDVTRPYADIYFPSSTKAKTLLFCTIEFNCVKKVKNGMVDWLGFSAAYTAINVTLFNTKHCMKRFFNEQEGKKNIKVLKMCNIFV